MDMKKGASSAPFPGIRSRPRSNATWGDMTYVREDRSLELFTKKALIVVAIGIALALLWIVRDIVVLVFIAAVLAAGIAPAVHWVRLRWRYWFHRHLPRGKAVMIV